MLRTGIETIICLSPNFLYVYVYVYVWCFTAWVSTVDVYIKEYTWI